MNRVSARKAPFVMLLTAVALIGAGLILARNVRAGSPTAPRSVVVGEAAGRTTSSAAPRLGLPARADTSRDAGAAAGVLAEGVAGAGRPVGKHAPSSVPAPATVPGGMGELRRFESLAGSGQ